MRIHNTMQKLKFITLIKFRKLPLIIALWLLDAQILFATTIDSTGLPWESPLEKILHSITGPVTKILGVIVIVIAGLGIAFGEAGSGMRRIFQIVFGLSIAFTATSLVVTLFGATGGVTF